MFLNICSPWSKASAVTGPAFGLAGRDEPFRTGPSWLAAAFRSCLSVSLLAVLNVLWISASGIDAAGVGEVAVEPAL